MASPLQHHPPRKGGQSHLCSAGLGWDHILVLTAKRSDMQAGRGDTQVWDSGGKGWSPHQNNTQVTK